MKKELIVKEESDLISFLRKELSNKSKNNIKTLIHKKMIKVNKEINIDPLFILKKGDKVEINNNYIFDKATKLNIEIIYEDKDIIVVNKPSGLLTIATKKENKRTLYNIIKNYLKAQNKNNKVFIIHRLDKGTSGVIMFAKNQQTKNLYQNNWDKLVTNKEYIAITKKGINNKGTIKSYLSETKEGKVYSSHIGKFALTKYEKLNENNKYAILKVNIKTGRKNQIRVHLSDINYPIVGDDKYMSDINPIKRLCLHSKKIEIINPKTKKKMVFDCKVPEEFSKLILVK